jgi:hypothetical protein
VTTYTIGKVADRTGFTASALRYYEGIGLVVPATRTDAGYRLYDEMTLSRLASHEPLAPLLERMTRRGVGEVIVATPQGELLGIVQRPVKLP